MPICRVCGAPQPPPPPEPDDEPEPTPEPEPEPPPPDADDAARLAMIRARAAELARLLDQRPAMAARIAPPIRRRIQALIRATGVTQ